MTKKNRCFGKDNTELAHYHDNEWGKPSHNDNHLFEMLILEGAQAGLNWELILEKRKGYQTLFCQFDPNKVAQLSDKELDQIVKNPKIIRNKRKVYSVRQNAQIFLEIQKEYGSFSSYLWGFVNNKPIKNHWKTQSQVPCETPLSEGIAKDLKKRGMTFVGPKIIYSYLQVVGVINDHLQDCWCY